jgi:hypothetical protein
MSPVEISMVLAIPAVVWLGLNRVCDLLWHRPWIASATVGVLVLVAALIALLKTVHEGRVARKAGEELRQMQLCYPTCHVKRLRSGEWFLTDRATGREYLGSSAGDTNA